MVPPTAEANRYGRVVTLLPGGPLLGSALRPLAAHLVRLVRPAAGETVLDLPCDGGALAAAVVRDAGGPLRVVGVDADPSALGDAARLGLRGTGWVRARPELPPLRAGRFDVAVSMLTLAHAPDPAAVVAAMARALRSGGRLAAAAWGERARVPHLDVLDAVLRDVLGIESRWLSAALGLGGAGTLEALGAAAGLGGAVVLRPGDVVRFEGAGHLLAAHLGDGGLGAEVGPLDAATAARLTAGLARRLEPLAARDGTLVVPVELAVLAVGVRG